MYLTINKLIDFYYYFSLNFNIIFHLLLDYLIFYYGIKLFNKFYIYSIYN